MSIIIRTKHEPWYLKLAGVPIPVALYAIFYYLGFIELAGFSLLCIPSFTIIFYFWLRDNLYPLDDHQYVIMPRQIIIKRGEVVGLDTYFKVRCSDCGKTYEKIRVTDYQLGDLLNMLFVRIGQYDRPSQDQFRDDGPALAKGFARYGIEFTTEETTLFHRFYTLEYDRSKRMLVFHKPPKEVEEIAGIRHAAVRVVSKIRRCVQNEVIYLLAVEAIIGDAIFVMSTYLMGIMKRSRLAWLHRTLHLLPLRINEHITWAIEDLTQPIKADRGGAFWRL